MFRPTAAAIRRAVTVARQPPVQVPATIPSPPGGATPRPVVNEMDSYLQIGDVSNTMHAIDRTVERAMRGLMLNVLITGLLLWGLVSLGVG